MRAKTPGRDRTWRKRKEASWAGEERARWWVLLSLQSDSQTQTERAQGPQPAPFPGPGGPTCQRPPFIIPRSPARLPVGAITPWERLSPRRNPAGPLTMFKTHSLE